MIPVFVKFILSIFLLIGIISTETTWAMTEGWKYKDAEPSDGYLIMTRVMSVIMMIVVWFVL